MGEDEQNLVDTQYAEFIGNETKLEFDENGEIKSA